MGWVENIHFKINWSDMTISYLGSNIIIYFMSYKSSLPALRGKNVISVALDESGDMTLEVYQELLRRFRGKSEYKPTMFISGTVQGADMDHWYPKMLNDKELTTISWRKVEDQQYPKFKAKDNIVILFMATHENIENLGEHYLKVQRDALGADTELYKQQILGVPCAATTGDSLIKLKGSNLKDRIELYTGELDTIVVGMDFNISNCAMTVSRQEDGIIKFCYDNKASAMDSYELSEQILEILPPEKYKNHDIIITGDSAGKARSTSAQDNKSNWDVIKAQLYGKYNNLEYIIPRSNPPVSNSIQQLNRLLTDNLIEISKEHCSELIRCLSTAEKTSNDTIKKSNNDQISHLVDACRYNVEVYHPSRRRYKSGSI